MGRRMRTIDVTDGRRLAEAILDVPHERAAEVVRCLAKSRRLSAGVRSLHHLLQDPEQRELAKSALHHMGFRDA